MTSALNKCLIAFLFYILSTTVCTAIEWGDASFTELKDNVKNVKDNVTTVTTKVTGNISKVSDEFSKQVDLLQNNGVLLKDSAQQLLEWLNLHKAEYTDFVGNNRCNTGSTCYIISQ